MNRHYYFRILALILAFGLWGCSQGPDPLEDWKETSLTLLDTNIAIQADYQSFLKKLPAEEIHNKGVTTCYQDKIGQNALRIVVPLNGAWLNYILIYDLHGKRIKTIRYKNGRYQS